VTVLAWNAQDPVGWFGLSSGQGHSKRLKVSESSVILSKDLLGVLFVVFLRNSVHEKILVVSPLFSGSYFFSLFIQGETLQKN
jgi:hypothetical protein